MIKMKTIQKALNEKYCNLNLYKDLGYFYFVYDINGTFNKRDIYETHSVMVNSLNQLTFDQWMEEAAGFMLKIRQLYDAQFFLEV